MELLRDGPVAELCHNFSSPPKIEPPKILRSPFVK